MFLALALTEPDLAFLNPAQDSFTARQAPSPAAEQGDFSDWPSLKHKQWVISAVSKGTLLCEGLCKVSGLQSNRVAAIDSLGKDDGSLKFEGQTKTKVQNDCQGAKVSGDCLDLSGLY